MKLERDLQAFQTQLFDKLDAELGVEEALGRFPDELGPEEAGVMPAEEVDAIVSAAVGRGEGRPSRLSVVGSRPPHSPRRRRRRRWIAGLTFVVAAAAVAEWRWELVNSRETLPYQEAFGVVVDDRYPAESRRAALGTIFANVRNAIEVIQGRRGSDLDGAANRALQSMRGFVLAPKPVEVPVSEVLSGELLETALEKLEAGRDTDDALVRVVELVKAGVCAIDAAPRFMKSLEGDSKIYLGHVRRLLERGPPGR